MKRFQPSITRIISAMVAVCLHLPTALFAYPGPIETWTWKYHEDGLFVPMQVSATTDSDGRLRTLFLDDSQPSYFYDGNMNRRVAPPVMQNFRAFPDGAIINEYRGLTVSDYTNSSNKATLASYNAALEPRRTAIYSARGDDTTFAIGGAYRRLLPTETFGAERSISHENHFIGLARRPVIDNAAYVGSNSDILAIASTPTKQNLDRVLNQGTLEVRSVTTTTPDLAIRYSQITSAGFTSVFLRSLADAAPVGWSTNRIFTGGNLAMTSDRRDFYAFVTSYKILLPSGQFATEARVFRMRTAGNTNDPIIAISAVTSHLVTESILPAGTPVSSALVYPQIAIPTTDEPKWIVWGNPGTDTVHAMKHVVGTSGTAEENLRTITSGYISGFGGTLGEIAAGSGPSIALDRLNLLHFAYRAGNYAVYGRENSGGGFTSWALFGSCRGAPAVAVGPGQYPYVVYRGIKSGSPNNIDKLVIAYPAELEAAYKGDYEDRDKDGRLGLIERAQGSNDNIIESASHQAALQLTPSLVQIAPGDRRFEMRFRMAPSTVRQGSSDVWHLADGSDTLEIRPADADHPTGPYFAGGYSVVEDFATASARFVTVRHPTPVGPTPPSQFFIFQVRRILGPP